MTKLKYTKNFVITYLNNINITLISEYFNTKQHISLLCNICGYTWNTTFSDIKNKNTRCSGKCLSEKKQICQQLSQEKLQKILKEKNVTLLSKYKNVYTKINVKCVNCNFKWQTNIKTLKKGKGCKKCRLCKALQESEKNIKYILQEKNIILLEKYDGINISNKFQCIKCKKTWKTSFSNLQKSLGCSICSNSYKRNTLKKIKNRCFERNIIIVNLASYKTNKTKLLIKCINCHYIWNSRYNDIDMGHGCPKCNTNNKSQQILFQILKKLYPNSQYFYNYKSFDWLKKQEIDIFIKNKQKNFSLAVEYDGIQHYKPVKYFGGFKKFLYIQKMDKIKNKKILENKQDVKYFIRFMYKDILTLQQIKEKLIKNYIPVFEKNNV